MNDQTGALITYQQNDQVRSEFSLATLAVQSSKWLGWHWPEPFFVFEMFFTPWWVLQPFLLVDVVVSGISLAGSRLYVFLSSSSGLNCL